MKYTQQLEDRLTQLISDSDNDDLMNTWIEYLQHKKSNQERLENRIDKNDPVIIGALFGALVGSILSKD